MRIGILGSGLIGGKLGIVLARAGHEVVFSYARTEEKLEKLAGQAGKNGRAGTPADAVRGAGAVLLAVHWTRVGDVLRQAGSLAGKVLVTCSLPMNKLDTRMVVGHTTSGAETLARRARDARVVSAFSTIPSEVLFSVSARRRRGARFDLVYCGDDKRAKRMVAGLIRDVGFHPVDLGPLSMARYIEPFSLLNAQLAYDGSGSPTLAYRFERLPARAR
jgi:predicted dinucleotide-binding enzyme